MHGNVILLSYNRPRMVREAVRSVLTQTHSDLTLWIYDDGSDLFDIYDVASEFDDERIYLCKSPPIPAEERIQMNSTRWSTNINTILAQIPKGEFVLYLCDDDILHYDWLVQINRCFTEKELCHVLLGDLYWFYDGDDPYKTGKKGFLSKIDTGGEIIEGRLFLWWSLGDFAHRSECFYDCDLKWRRGHEGHGHSYDVEFINAMSKNHVAHLIAPIPAVYRREHVNTLSYRLGRIEDGYYTKTGGKMEPEHVFGLME